MDPKAVQELRKANPDLKESMEIGRSFTVNLPSLLIYGCAGVVTWRYDDVGKEPSPGYANNWPTGNAEFKRTMMDFYEVCTSTTSN